MQSICIFEMGNGLCIWRWIHSKWMGSKWYKNLLLSPNPEFIQNWHEKTRWNRIYVQERDRWLCTTLFKWNERNFFTLFCFFSLQTNFTSFLCVVKFEIKLNINWSNKHFKDATTRMKFKRTFHNFSPLLLLLRHIFFSLAFHFICLMLELASISFRNFEYLTLSRSTYTLLDTGINFNSSCVFVSFTSLNHWLWRWRAGGVGFLYDSINSNR